MKKILLLIAVCMCGTSVFAQKAKTERFEFSYTQLPRTPFENGQKTFKVETVLAYESEREEDMKLYEAKVKAAEEKHAAELAAYDSASTGKKIADKLLWGEGKPAEKAELPKKPYFTKLYDQGEISFTYGKIQGLEVDETADVTLRLVLEGFDWSPVLERKDKKGGIYHVMELSYPLKVEVISGSGSVLFESYINDSQKEKAYKVNKFKSDADKYAFLYTKEEEIIRGHLSKVEAILGEEFGYMEKSYKASLVEPSSRKHEYPEYRDAIKAAMLGYSSLSDGGEEYLNNAIGIWEKALEESDVDNKRARINKHVTAATQCAIAEAYMWLNNFEKAKYYLTLARLNDVGRFNRRSSNIKEFMEAYQLRFEANQLVTTRND